MRLLPLALALASTALVFGLLELVGGSLTMASIAVLPILIGLAVDYAIQFQARFDEVLATGATGEAAARTAANLSGPTIATACLATAAGFLVLLLSPTPMVRGFGVLLVVGVLLAFVLVMTAGFAALSLRHGGWRLGGAIRGSFSYRRDAAPRDGPRSTLVDPHDPPWSWPSASFSPRSVGGSAPRSKPSPKFANSPRTASPRSRT